MEQGFLPCGVDEAGRGPWAGPVVAAAVILDESNIPAGLNDSKKLTEARRDALFDPIMKSARVGVGIVAAARIDEINILQATYEAMGLAVDELGGVCKLCFGGWQQGTSTFNPCTDDH